jgi:hypothetical protein
MSFWNGTQWVSEEHAPNPKRTHFSVRSATLVSAIALATLIMPFNTVVAASHKADPGCTVSPNPAAVGQPYVVSAWGLPTGTAINLWVTDPTGKTTGRPLGGTGDGTFNLNESSSFAGTWTYAFSGPTKNHMSMDATCSVDAY